MKHDSRIFVSKGMAIIRCPECYVIKQIQVGGFEDKNHSLNVKCTCGKKFQVDLNFREGIRKDTNFAGKYRQTLGLNSGMHECEVVNLSFRGLRLKVNDNHKIKIGDELEIEFILNGKQNILITRSMVVRNLNQKNFVGGEFLEIQQDNANKHICLALMS